VGLDFHNNAAQRVVVAVAFPDPSCDQYVGYGVRLVGWYHIDPGRSFKVLDFPLYPGVSSMFRSYYFFAHTRDKTLYWQGGAQGFVTYLPHHAFDHCNGQYGWRPATETRAEFRYIAGGGNQTTVVLNADGTESYR